MGPFDLGAHRCPHYFCVHLFDALLRFLALLDLSRSHSSLLGHDRLLRFHLPLGLNRKGLGLR